MALFLVRLVWVMLLKNNSHFKETDSFARLELWYDKGKGLVKGVEVNVGIRDTFNRMVSTRTETGEEHPIKELQTRYYKTTKDKAMRAVEDVVKQRGFSIKRSEEDRGEIVAQTTSGKKVLLVVSVITVKPYRTAVDFSCATETALPSDFGYSRKLTLALYKELDQSLPYVGSALGSELL